MNGLHTGRPHFAAAGLLLFLLGCVEARKQSDVTGVVTLDGQPLVDASVTFVPEGEGQPAHAQTDKTGVYHLATGMQAGATPGNYKVVVTKDDLPPMDPSWTPQQKMDARLKASKKPAKSLVPNVYTASGTTPLRCVVPVTNGKFDVDLKTAP
jgi:hypothetical protein